jgi:hypothetical protein
MQSEQLQTFGSLFKAQFAKFKVQLFKFKAQFAKGFVSPRVKLNQRRILWPELD